MPSKGRTPLVEWNGQSPTPFRQSLKSKGLELHSSSRSSNSPTPLIKSNNTASGKTTRRSTAPNVIRSFPAPQRDLQPDAVRAITLESRLSQPPDISVEDSEGNLMQLTLSDTETSEDGDPSYPTRYESSSLPGIRGDLRRALRGPSRRPPPNSPTSLIASPILPPHRPQFEMDLPYPDESAVRWVKALQTRIAILSPPRLSPGGCGEDEIPSLSAIDLNHDSSACSPVSQPTTYPLSSTPLHYADSPSSFWSQPSAEPSQLRSSFVPPTSSPSASSSKLMLRHSSPAAAGSAMDALWEYESTLSSSTSSFASARSSPFESPLPSLELNAEQSLFHSFKDKHDIRDDTNDADDVLQDIAQDIKLARLPFKYEQPPLREYAASPFACLNLMP